MEHVLNAQSRNRAFVKFTAFFLLTVMLMTTAIYFDFYIPTRENQFLRERIRKQENQLYAQQKFITDLENAKSLIDSFGKSGQFNALLDREIAKQLDLLKNPEYQDSSRYSRMNKDVFNLCYDYHELNKKWLQSSMLMQQTEAIKNELNQCRVNLVETQRSLDVLRNGNNLEVR